MYFKIVNQIKNVIGEYIINFKNLFRFFTNKLFRKYILYAIKAPEFEADYMYIIEKHYLEFVLDYMQKGLYSTEDTYNHITKWMEIALYLNDVITNTVDLYHFDGDYELVPYEKNPKLSRLVTDKLIYYCDVNVNLNNMTRFVTDEKRKEFIKSHPHELYMIKAKELYHKIMCNYLSTWWD